MSARAVEPKLGVESFSCPHCGALAHQTWYRVFLKGYDTGSGPARYHYEYAKDVDLDQIKAADQARMARMGMEKVAAAFRHEVETSSVNPAPAVSKSG